METTGFLLVLAVAAIVGIVTEIVVPARVPGGLSGAIVVGLLGALLGGWVFATFAGTDAAGPIVQGIAIIPAVVGAIIVVFFVGLVGGARAT